MDLFIAKLLAKFVLPPGGNLVLGIGGLCIARRWPRCGLALVWVSMLALLVFSTPVFVDPFLRDGEPIPAVDLESVPLEQVGAIVLLGGGRNPNQPDYGGDTLSDASLVRARYAAHLQRLTGIPILVTGGVLREEARPEADLIAQVLEEEFSVPVRWRETKARNTAENATYSASMLRESGIGEVLLVTHARHMPRSVAQFEASGLTVWPAPTRFHLVGDRGIGLSDFLPSAGALEDSRRVLHEWVGRIWYWLRY